MAIVQRSWWRRPTRRLLTILAGITVVTGAFAAQASIASAHGDHPTPQQLCGADYRVKHTEDLWANRRPPEEPVKVGRIVVLDHASSTTHCVVTMRNYHSSSSRTAIRIKHEGDADWSWQDVDDYRYFAGPLSLSRGSGRLIVQGGIGPIGNDAWARLNCGPAQCERVDGGRADWS
jgi:hypothetical protein